MDLSIFTHIARGNGWGSSESISGPGSTVSATATLRRHLPDVLARLNIRMLVDAPCGDLNWMRHLGYAFEKYIGIDLVPSLIEKLKSEAFPKGYHFQVGNIVTDVLPAADAILCRDCLVHLPFKAIHEAMRLWRLAGFRYVLATTFTDHATNEDCQPGGWRPLNLQAVPFLWPSPDAVIPDNDGLAPPYNDKALGVWAL
jgi:hypothetical protein